MGKLSWWRQANGLLNVFVTFCNSRECFSAMRSPKCCDSAWAKGRCNSKEVGPEKFNMCGLSSGRKIVRDMNTIYNFFD